MKRLLFLSLFAVGLLLTSVGYSTPVEKSPYGVNVDNDVIVDIAVISGDIVAYHSLTHDNVSYSGAHSESLASMLGSNEGDRYEITSQDGLVYDDILKTHLETDYGSYAKGSITLTKDNLYRYSIKTEEISVNTGKI